MDWIIREWTQIVTPSLSEANVKIHYSFLKKHEVLSSSWDQKLNSQIREPKDMRTLWYTHLFWKCETGSFYGSIISNHFSLALSNLRNVILLIRKWKILSSISNKPKSLPESIIYYSIQAKHDSLRSNIALMCIRTV